MPIISRNVPRPAAARLATHLTELMREHKAPPGMPVEMHLEKVSHSEPHAVYFVPLDALAQGKLLDAATQTSWRYLLVQDDEPIAEAELSAGSGATGAKGAKRTKGARVKPLQFLGLTHGPFTGATVEALHAAERMPKVAAADYDMRLLKIPAVYLAALWLHADNDDILIPMGNPPAGLKKNRPYTEKAIIKALQPVAEQTKQFHDAYSAHKRKPRGKKKS
jgi:hypothetical protein